jgi:ceramide glucosyltransferase
MRITLAIVLGMLLAGSWVYCLIVIAAVRSYFNASRRKKASAVPIPLSVLKPLHGLDLGLEENLRTFFEQEYPSFELLFAARNETDEGLALARRLALEYPAVPSRFLVTGEPPYPNAKVWSLEWMTRAAAHDVLVMSDSDIRAGRDLLQGIAAEFADPSLGVATCPYRAVPGASFWSMLEAIGMNTEFWGGAMAARLVERGVHFAIGPTLTARRSALEAVGGFEVLSQYLAEDFVLGQFAAERGIGVILSAQVVEHHIGAQGWRTNFGHRLRWNRSTRRSRPAGYLGQIFTNPIPLALLFVAAAPSLWPWALAITAAVRAAAAYSVSEKLLRDPLCRRHWLWIPVQDLVSACFWLAGFFGDTVSWGGRRYRVLPDGRFELTS